jgi:universal stress protein A
MEIPVELPVEIAPGELTARLTAAVRLGLEESLRGAVPAEAISHLEVRLGKSWSALAQAVGEHDAGLLVLGGKHHAPPARWFGASTVHHAVRTVDVPILVTVKAHHTIKRVLATLDLSHAAAPTLKKAMQFSDLYGAELHVLHVVEPLPLLDELPVQVRYQDDVRQSEERFQEIVDHIAAGRQIERVVCAGVPSSVVAEVATEWRTDLLVVGSHGKGWVDRMLIGSTTERLINRLPTSILVVPVTAPNDTASESSDLEASESD